MSLRVTIQTAILAATSVTDIIGTGTSCRHYAGRVPQSPTLPFVVSYEITSNGEDTHGSPEDAEDTLDQTILQFSCYAENLTTALSLRLALRAALLDPTVTAPASVLDDADVVVTSPQTREQHEEGIDVHCAQLDLTFFHNPNT